MRICSYFVSCIFIFDLFLFSFESLAKETPTSQPRPSLTKSETIELTALSESRIQLDGDSTLRKYASVATQFDLKLKIKKQPFETILPWTPEQMTLSVPISKMKSDDSTLDEHMRDALHEKSHPDIFIKLTKFKINSGQPQSMDASGEITVSGKTRPIDIKSALMIQEGKIKATGSKKLLMSEFEIEPPSLFLGTIKVEDQVMISFEVLFPL